MDMIYTVTFFGSIALGLIVLAAIALSFLSGAGPGAPVLLYDMLRHQGDGVARLAIASGSRGFELAVRECLHCSNTAQCKAWLDSRRREGFEAFCANAGYVSRMRNVAALAGSS
jgi:hypothetical protein